MYTVYLTNCLIHKPHWFCSFKCLQNTLRLCHTVAASKVYEPGSGRSTRDCFVHLAPSHCSRSLNLPARLADSLTCLLIDNPILFRVEVVVAVFYDKNVSKTSRIIFKGPWFDLNCLQEWIIGVQTRSTTAF